ncbi:hypothetical protein GH5_05469 [Leishmania sp. Ghana 2012 LV757]|uniref:hypothetical protein n=1 Tax=Leishmania sp. Ghana 2012 LV757 TaxID=2803181 RepID=UPI001B7B61BF|nr:hypothetical protein GH5_05469 [Leishmania sp. Ghana 2012 LV757]
MALCGKAIGALRRHQDVAVSATVLSIVLCVCVPLVVVVPASQPYGATLIAWTLAFTVRAWRLLPWERARVRRAAHLMADARMQQSGVGKVLMPYAEATHSLLSVSRSKADHLPSGTSTSPPSRCRGFLTIESLSSTSARRALPVMEGYGIADSCSGRGRGAGAASSDVFLSASALESSAQFLALAHGASRQESPWPIGDRHTSGATPSGSRSGSGRRASRRSHEPFTLLSHTHASDATALSEDSGAMPSIVPATLLSMPPSTNTSSDTHGCTGNAMAVESLPQAPVLGDAVESSVWPPADLTNIPSNAETPLSLYSPPKARQPHLPRGTSSPPTCEEAVLPSSHSSLAQISVVSSTLRPQRFSPAVARDGAR